MPERRSSSRFSRHLIIAFSIVAMVNLVYGIYSIQRIKSVQHRIEEQASPALFEFIDLQTESKNSIQEAFAYVVSGIEEEKAEFLAFNRSLASRARIFREISELDNSAMAAQSRSFDEILTLQETMGEQAAKMLAEFETTGSVSLATFHDLEFTIDLIDQLSTELVRQKEQDLASARLGYSQLLSQTTMNLGILAAVALMMIGLLSFALVRSFDQYSKQQKLAEEVIQNKHAHVAEELSKAKKEIVVKTRLAALGQMSAQIAHEMRNPLCTVNNAVFYLKRQVPEENKKWTEYLVMIEEQVRKCNQIITGLLDVSRGKKPVRKGICLSDVVNHAISQNEVPQEVRVDIKLEPVPFEIQADEIQMIQVIDNLFRNSLDAVGAQGNIEIRAIRMNANDFITIRDDGRGVPENQQHEVFAPLFTTKPDGTGLGLPICKQIVELHGGSLELNGSDNSGTIFQIILPRII